jgi:hypothetical protein
MALGRNLREGMGQAHPWGVKTIVACRRSRRLLLQQNLPAGLRAVNQGQGAVGLQQAGISGQTGTAQNDAGHTLLCCVLTSLAKH